MSGPVYVVSADTLDSILDAADLERLDARTGSRRASIRLAVDSIGAAVAAYLAAHGLEGDVERVYETSTRRDSDDADPRTWDAVLIAGIDALRAELLGVSALAAGLWTEHDQDEPDAEPEDAGEHPPIAGGELRIVQRDGECAIVAIEGRSDVVAVCPLGAVECSPGSARAWLASETPQGRSRAWERLGVGAAAPAVGALRSAREREERLRAAVAAVDAVATVPSPEAWAAGIDLHELAGGSLEALEALAVEHAGLDALAINARLSVALDADVPIGVSEAWRRDALRDVARRIFASVPDSDACSITSTKGTHAGTLRACVAWHAETQGWGAELRRGAVSIRLEDDDLRALGREALEGNDPELAADVAAALGGDVDALARCAEVMLDAAMLDAEVFS